MSDILGKFMSVWLKPWGAMASLKEEPETQSVKPYVLFIVVMGLLSGLLNSIMGTIFPVQGVEVAAWMKWIGVIVVPLLALGFSFVYAFLLWGFVHGFLTGTPGQYWKTYKLLALLAAFTPVSAILSPLPTVGVFLGALITVWVAVVLIRGLIIVFETATVRTWVICGVFFGALLLFGLTARMALQQQLAGGFGGDQAGFGDLNQDFDFNEDELNAQLEELRQQTVENVENN